MGRETTQATLSAAHLEELAWIVSHHIQYARAALQTPSLRGREASDLAIARRIVDGLAYALGQPKVPSEGAATVVWALDDLALKYRMNARHSRADRAYFQAKADALRVLSTLVWDRSTQDIPRWPQNVLRDLETALARLYNAMHRLERQDRQQRVDRYTRELVASIQHFKRV